MRISTSLYYTQAVTAIDTQQANLANLQVQMSSGLRINSAEDDPVGAGQILNINQSLNDNARWTSNATALQSRLALEDSTLQSVSQILNKVNGLAIQGNSGGLTDADRKAVAQQLQQLLNQLVTQANTRDGQGIYLFGGTQNGSAPFTVTATGVAYNGSSNVNMVPVGASNSVQDTDAGDYTFMNVKNGNGTFQVAANAANSGTGQITDATLSAPAQWVPDNYTISFLAGNYTVTDSLGNTVSSGAFTPGQAIQFNGASITINGTPADGDSFTVSPSQNQSVFTTLQNLINDFTAPNSSNAVQSALNQTALFADLQSLNGAMGHITDVNAGVGAREQALGDITSQLSAFKLQMQTALSGVQDVDYAAVSSQFSQSQLILQASEQSYVAVKNLSLFNFLK
jgi:flagellar hook-associated protein 3 FlgL